MPPHTVPSVDGTPQHVKDLVTDEAMTLLDASVNRTQYSIKKTRVALLTCMAMRLCA